MCIRDSNKVRQFLSLDKINKYNEIVAKLPDEVDPILQVYSGYMMIMITEAPHYNLYKWTSRNYDQKGIVYKMTRHGYHSANIWYSLLFQILAGLYVMQIHGIYMRNMSIRDNIYAVSYTHLTLPTICSV